MQLLIYCVVCRINVDILLVVLALTSNMNIQRAPTEGRFSEYGV